MLLILFSLLKNVANSNVCLYNPTIAFLVGSGYSTLFSPTFLLSILISYFLAILISKGITLVQINIRTKYSIKYFKKVRIVNGIIARYYGNPVKTKIYVYCSSYNFFNLRV